MTALVSAKQVVKRYGTLTALDGVSLDIAPGEFLGLLGPNGAGKSTFISLVAGLRTPESGTLEVSGAGPAGSSAAREAIGLVPQHVALYEDLSAEENLAIFGGLHGLRGDKLKKQVSEALVAAQLVEKKGVPVATFSGGMKRRLNIVAALLHTPSVLLCDEPTVGVDPQARNALFEMLQKRNRDGLTVVYSTHYMEEAARLCSRIAIIDHGRILALGTLDELLRSLPFEEEIRFPAGPETAAFAADLAAHGDLSQAEGSLRFRPAPGYPLSAFYALSERHGLPPGLFSTQRPSLESVFLQHTGRNLRE